MVKKFVLFLGAVIIILPFVLRVFAHPGGTDSNGGHYVSHSGEYHYHHGRSAHDHIDTDGDEIPDCPYDQHYQASDISKSIAVSRSNAKIADDTKKLENAEEKSNVLKNLPVSIILYGIYCIIASIVCLCISIMEHNRPCSAQKMKITTQLFFHFLLWTSLPVSCVFFALCGSIIEIHSFIIWFVNSRKTKK